MRWRIFGFLKTHQTSRTGLPMKTTYFPCCCGVTVMSLSQTLWWPHLCENRDTYIYALSALQEKYDQFHTKCFTIRSFILLVLPDGAHHSVAVLEPYPIFRSNTANALHWIQRGRQILPDGTMPNRRTKLKNLCATEGKDSLKMMPLMACPMR